MEQKLFDDDVVEFCQKPRYISDVQVKFATKLSQTYVVLDRLENHGKLQKWRDNVSQRWIYQKTGAKRHDPFSMAGGI